MLGRAAGLLGRVNTHWVLPAPSVRRAWVFWDRIEGAGAQNTALGLLLGYVMAHELGHLMLSSPAHSLRGIMRAQAPMQMRATETFPKLQAREILSRLQQLASGRSGK